MSDIMSGYTQPLLEGHRDEDQLRRMPIFQPMTATTTPRKVWPRGCIATKKVVYAIILITVVLVLINILCIILVAHKTNAVFKALQGWMEFVDTRDLPRPEQYGL